MLVAILMLVLIFQSQHATCHLVPSGMKFVVEEAKCLQAKAFFQTSMFQSYQVDEEETAFRIDLEVLLVRPYRDGAYSVVVG